jgi:hypothetical protein
MGGEKVYPTVKEEFHGYIVLVFPYIDSNQTRLGVSAGNFALLKAAVGDATTADSYIHIYNRWNDEMGGRTKTVIKMLDAKEDEIKSILSVIYDDIPASVWTQVDRDTLGRKTGLPKTKSVKNTPIAEFCYPHVTLLGNGDIKLVCSILNDKTVASKPNFANALEIAGRMDDPIDASKLADPLLAGKVKYAMIKSPDDGTQKTLYTKTTFIIHLGAENSGKYFQFYARWTNIQHPEIAGTWTGPWTELIP